MGDGFYEDDFEDELALNDEPGRKQSTGVLMPIVEVSSDEPESRPNTGRSELSIHQTDTIQENSEESDDASPPATGRSSARNRHRRKVTVRNGKYSEVIDMTPPEKLLKKAEKKSKRYQEKKKIDAAMEELIRCTALAKIVYGDGHWRLARSHSQLAQGYFDLKNYATQTQYHADIAKDILIANVQLSSSATDKPLILETLLSTYYNLGRALAALQKYGESSQALSKAEKLLKEYSKQSSVSDSELDEWDIKLSISQGRLNGRQHNHAVATTYFEKALEVMESKYGRDSTKLIPVYQALGKIEQSKGDHANHEKAIEHFLQAHSISAANYKDPSIRTAETGHALATAYSNVGEMEAEVSAESYLNECLATYQSVYGPNHEKTIEIQDELARLMVRTDRSDDAVSMLKSSMEPKKDIYGDLSGNVAETWKLMGNIFLSQGDSEKALRALKKCHTVECSVYGTNHRKSKDTERTMELLLANPNLKSKQKKTKAEEMKERPRFNVSTKKNTGLGGFKPQAAY